jgi:hypothetical protein
MNRFAHANLLRPVFNQGRYGVVLMKIAWILLIIALIGLSACGKQSPKEATGNLLSVQADVKNDDIVANDQNDNIVARGGSPESDIQQILGLNKTENIGKKVTVQGEVVSVLQLPRYGISGYKVQDSTGAIDVSSPNLPVLHSKVTVTGTLQQSQRFGIIIKEG